MEGGGGKKCDRPPKVDSWHMQKKSVASSWSTDKDQTRFLLSSIFQ